MFFQLKLQYQNESVIVKFMHFSACLTKCLLRLVSELSRLVEIWWNVKISSFVARDENKKQQAFNSTSKRNENKFYSSGEKKTRKIGK